MSNHNISSDVATEAMKGVPPVAVAAASVVGAVDWQSWVLILTVVYLLMQMAYLAAKSWREFIEKRDEA